MKYDYACEANEVDTTGMGRKHGLETEVQERDRNTGPGRKRCYLSRDGSAAKRHGMEAQAWDGSTGTAMKHGYGTKSKTRERDGTTARAMD